MSTSRFEGVLAELRAVRLSLLGRGLASRAMVRLLDVLEVGLTDGLNGLATRVMRRAWPRKITSPAAYVPSPPTTDPLPALTISPLTDVGGVSVIIPVFNQATLTHDCLRALIEHTTPGHFEVLVVDNGSDDTTRAVLSRVSGLRVIRNDENVGFVQACNQGARDARTNLLLFLNNDTYVLPGWLEALTDTLRRGADIGAVGAKLLYPAGRLQEAGTVVWRDGTGWNYGRGGDPQAPEFNYVREVDYCSAACLLVRRGVFEAMHGFDLRYAPAYYEDADLCFRLREHGYRVLYQPRAEVVHLEGATGGSEPTSGFKRYQEINRRSFVARHVSALCRQTAPDPRLLRCARDRRPGKRILVVDHMVPQWDMDSGSVRMAAILRILADRGHRVTFLPDDLNRVEPYTSELQQLGIETLYGPLLARRFIRRHAAEYDVVILCRAHIAIKYATDILKRRRRPGVIFDTVDLHHRREQGRSKSARAALSAAEHLESLEQFLVDASDMVWVTSSAEAELLRKRRPALRLEIVPNVHDVRSDVPPFAARRDLLFVGSFRHAPNVDAVLYFVQSIWPLVKQRLPAVRLLIVGPDAPAEILKLARSDIQVLGHVQKLEQLADACRLSIAPLRFGAGVKGKISQSLAWGLPVVATPTGVEGMDLTHGTNVMIGATPEAFARHVVELCQNEALWTRLSHSGRQHAESYFGFTPVAAVIERALASASNAVAKLG
jgi:GT2 family glycosyltransferase